MPLPIDGPRRVHAVAHGGDLDFAAAVAGCAPDELLDFSVNTSPFGPSPAAVAAARAAPLDRYPQPGSPQLRRLLARRLAIDESQLLVTAGTTEALGLIASAYLGPHRRALIFGPTYGEYDRVARLVGADVTVRTACAGDGFSHHIGRDAAHQLRDLAPDVCFLCNPNNPTGVRANPGEVATLLDAIPAGLVVLDEAYAPFVTRQTPEAVRPLVRENAIVCRSLTKDHALAGLRVGYVVGHAGVIERLAQVQPPWSVSTVAEAAACAAVADDAYLHASLTRIDQAHAYLVAGLQRLRLRHRVGAAHFLLIEVDHSTAWQHALLRWGCYVRDCASFGLPTFLRIAPRSIADCDRLLAALAAVRDERLVSAAPP